MSEQVKDRLQTPEEKGTPTAPVWILALMLLLMFAGGVYFDRHSAWFDSQVYTPYTSADELKAYQPRSGMAAMLAEGQRTYGMICAACHSDDGLGKPSQAPPLAGSAWVNSPDLKRIEEIPELGLSGQVHVAGQVWNLQMPPMGAAMSDADLAAVLTYIRNSWGNKASEVTQADVKAMRAAVAGHPPIAGEQGLDAIK